MDCISITTYAVPGKPQAVGHLGTVIATPQESGEIKIEFTLRRKGMRELRHPNYRKLDEPKEKVYPDDE